MRHETRLATRHMHPWRTQTHGQAGFISRASHLDRPTAAYVLNIIFFRASSRALCRINHLFIHFSSKYLVSWHLGLDDRCCSCVTRRWRSIINGGNVPMHVGDPGNGQIPLRMAPRIRRKNSLDQDPRSMSKGKKRRNPRDSVQLYHGGRRSYIPARARVTFCALRFTK